MMHTLKQLFVICRWLLAVFVFLFALVFGFKPCSLLFVLAALLIAPIKAVTGIWDTLHIKYPILRGFVILCVFLGACALSPAAPPDTGNDGADVAVTETTTETVAESSEAEKTETVSAFEEQERETEAVTEEKTEITTEDITNENSSEEPTTEEEDFPDILLSDIPIYSGKPYVEVYNNVPRFKHSELSTESFEFYDELDALGRCGVTYACIGKDIMPTEERGPIGQVKPTGWHLIKYDFIDGLYLYNRCHLIGYQLTGENANTKNLITGTRSMNVDGMLPFENLVADYIHRTNNHVMYRVTPMFDGDNLLAHGVLMEAKSVEDTDIAFNVFVYNVQDGVFIDYATGDNRLADDMTTEEVIEETTEASTADATEDITEGDGILYIMNTNTKKFHFPDCSSVAQMSKKNYREFFGHRDELIKKGYSPCKRCNP